MSKPQSESGSRKRELFLKALEKESPEERAAFLDVTCGEDAELRAGVEALLRSHRDDSFLEQAAVAIDPAHASTISITEKPGDRIDRYKLLEKIGEGGCGVVYVAEQEEPVRRRVALKVIKLGMDTKSVIARFEAERQALAMMDHPHIAKVLDAGATETGRPYFVMELVRGIRITDYCDQAKLPMAQRLALFRQVCSAVQHAHQKGIIHRDLKPSNILVTLHDGVPMPKVIDFGIAKATEGRLTDKTVYTELHQFIGTPAYMSPEQAEMSALDIDTRSDIYSLGVLLYEVLTGRPPFDAKELMQAGFDEMRRRIREEEPQRPSTRLSTLLGADLTTVANQRQAEAPKLITLLRGDLDWIVMKALEKDRTRRYETANGLAADIQRHLSNEPVVARPPSRLYQFQKTVQRNKVAFTAAVAVMLVLVGGIAATTWQAVRATQAERKQAEARERAETSERKAKTEATRAEVVVEFLQEALFAVNSQSGRGKDVLLRDVLDETARKLDEGAFKDHPETEASLRETVGGTYVNLGQEEKARPHLEKAVALRHKAFGERHEATAESLRRLASLEVENSSWARQLLIQALEIQRAVATTPSIELARTLGQLGPHEPDEPAKQARYREALEVYRQVGITNTAETSWITHNLALSLRDSGDLNGAITLLQTILEAQERDMPGSSWTARTLLDLAYTLNLDGRPELVEDLYRESLRIFRRVSDAAHPEMDECVQRLSEFLSSRGQADKAEAVLLEHYAVVKADPHSSPEAEKRILKRIVTHYEAQHSTNLTEWRAKLELIGTVSP